MPYNWELADWPYFSYELEDIEAVLYAFSSETGEVNGILKSLPVDLQQETLLQLMLAEAIKTSEIEGEFLSRKDVASSIRNHLGLTNIPSAVHDRQAAGIAELMFAVRRTFRDELDRETLWNWHRMLMGAGRLTNIGSWRTGNEPMQVISGPIGRENIHFQAPPSDQVAAEMERFLQWFNATAPEGPKAIRSAAVRAAIAHLYFESIHPFEDGNGRIGRVIAEKAISQTLGRPAMLSLSRTIESDKRAYYNALESAQRSNSITEWITYFANTALSAQREAKRMVEFILQKAIFFDRYREQLNDRHTKVLKKMFDAGPEGFKGGMTAAKYMSITKTSKATATRDLQMLHEIGAFLLAGAGRTTHYTLNIKS